MVALFVLDRGQRCSFLNAIAEMLTGLQVVQAAGKTFRDLIWQNTKDPFDTSTIGRVLASGEVGEGQATITDRHGASRSFAFRILPVDLNAPRAATIVELVDLSGETQTGRALRESEQRLRLAVAATGIGIWDVDATSGDRRWSPEFCAILGLASDVTPSTELFLSLVRPADRVWLEPLYAQVYADPANGHYAAEFRIRRANDGVERWVSTTGRITFDANGRAIRGIGTLNDIDDHRRNEAALRESEERHRLAVEANGIGTWEYDFATRELAGSDQFRDLWGLAAGPELNSGLLRPLLDPRDWDQASRLMLDAREPKSGGRIAAEYQIRRADTGERRWCSFSGRVLFNAAGDTALRVVGIMMDITPRKAAEERQRRVLREMHHRVKNSLAVVQAIVSQTLRTNPMPDEAFERIQSRLMSMARTHDFLNQSDWGEISLRGLLQRELDVAADQTASRASLAGPPILLDSNSTLALGIAFHELATNAVRFGSLSVPSGRVETSWAIVDRDRPQVEIVWTELGGPEPRSVKPGLGIRLIEGALRGSLGGDATMEVVPEGMRWRMHFPLPELAEDMVREAQSPPPVGSR